MMGTLIFSLFLLGTTGLRSSTFGFSYGEPYLLIMPQPSVVLQAGRNPASISTIVPLVRRDRLPDRDF